MLVMNWNKDSVRSACEKAQLLDIQNKYDGLSFSSLPKPDDRVALSLYSLVYKEYYTYRHNQYYTMFPMENGL